MSPPPALGLFEAYGVEIELMIVDAATLDPAPLAEAALAQPGGAPPDDVEFDDLCWSNELVCHVIELKVARPAPRLEPLAQRFADHVGRVRARLAPLGARLLPTAMHPWMDPLRQTRLWPWGAADVYRAYDRIFDCRGHGWANLQSMHLNLPFDGDEQFGRLHAAVRVVLPLLPALAASSPLAEGRRTGRLDTRLDYYRLNQRRIPAIAGRVIPEPVFTRAAYEARILEPMYRAIEPLDPEGILRHEWLNSRGAIARFDRSTIEIRLIDTQECPAADLAVATLVVEALEAMVDERWAPLARACAMSVERLARLLERTIAEADEAAIDDPEYAALWGWAGPIPCRAGDLWRHVATQCAGALEPWRGALTTILDDGVLARRILRALPPGDPPDRRRLRAVYERLADCLDANRSFVP